MKISFRKFLPILSLLVFAILLIPAQSCSRKSGCPANEDATVKTNKKGELPTASGRSQLFPKNMRKRNR
jgi:hypothetical protein